MLEKESLQRFLIEHTNVRGEWVHLDATWQAVLERADYPPAVREPLGEAMAAVALLAATNKFNGSLTLQVSGDGPISLLVVQATAAKTLRGLAHWRSDVPEGSLAARFGHARIVITIDPGQGKERYQGVVGLVGDHLGDALKEYFERSEQLPTQLWLAANEQVAAGLLLQKLPGETEDADAWNRTVTLAETVTRDELLALGADEVLRRLYHEEQVRLCERDPVSFRCTCSRERVADMILGLGPDEARSILDEQGEISVNCDFCNAHYLFDAVDVEQIFAAADHPPVKPTRH